MSSPLQPLDQPQGDPGAALADLATRLTGRLAFPGEEGYELATPWNVAIVREPVAVVEAADAQDVVETVLACRAAGLRLSVQRTGHGATPYDHSDVVILHTGRLDRVEIDAGTQVARLGGGVVFQQVLDAATPLGLAPVCGSTPTVGVAGFLTGGGIGPLSRTHGLSADHVRAFQVVTGDGRLLRAAPDEHPELFWGLRGGKGSLGIVTEIELGLIELPSFYGGALYFDAADAAAVFEAWRLWTQDLPEHANTSIAILQLPPLPHIPAPLAGRMSIAVRYTSVLTSPEAEALLAPMREVAEPILDGIGELPFSAIAAVHADPVDPMPATEGSLLLHEFTEETAAAFLAMLGPDSGSPQTVAEIRLLGGALGREGEHASAYSHRSAAFNVFTVGVLVPPIAEAVAPHAAAVAEALAPWATGSKLPNFATSVDPAVLAVSYDEPALSRLGALADEHDPAGVLRVGQVVRAGAAR